MKYFFLALTLLIFFCASALEYEYEGIIYTLSTDSEGRKICSTKRGSKSTITPTPGQTITGNVCLPQQVPYNGENYTLVSIGAYSFSTCKIKNVVLPPTISTIGEEAFAYSTITSINIPDGVSILSEIQTRTGQFRECHDLETVVIGKNVTSIFQLTFWNCRKLKDIYCYAPNPPELDTYFSNEVFYGMTRSEVNLHVLPNSVPLYSKESEWCDFNIIGDLKEEIEATSISLNKTELILRVNESDDLIAILEPVDASNEITWSALPEGIVSVENGHVVALKSGTATVTATAGGVSASCNVEVFDNTPDLTVVNNIVYLEPGQKYPIQMIFGDNTSDSNADIITPNDDFIISSSSCEDVVPLRENFIEALDYGHSHLTIAYKNKNIPAHYEIEAYVCPTLTVEHGDGIVYSHPVIYNSRPSLSLGAGAGYRLAGATHDGHAIDEVLVNNEGKYVPLEPIKKNTVINLALEYDSSNEPTTGTDALWSESKIRIYVEGHNVNIVGATPGAFVTMTNLSGVQLFHNKYYRINVIDPGIYLIKVEGVPQNFKILVK